jgi:hypothetical protein
LNLLTTRQVTKSLLPQLAPRTYLPQLPPPVVDSVKPQVGRLWPLPQLATASTTQYRPIPRVSPVHSQVVGLCSVCHGLRRPQVCKAPSLPSLIILISSHVRTNLGLICIEPHASLAGLAAISGLSHAVRTPQGSGESATSARGAAITSRYRCKYG